MSKMKIGIVTALLTMSVSVAAAKDKKQEETYDFTGFEKIEISGVFELDVRVGGDFSIELSGREREMERVEVKMKGETLVLGSKKRSGWGNNNKKAVKARITMPKLTNIDVSGVVDGYVQDIDSEKFEVDLSGVGDLDLNGKCGALEANVSGVGDLDAKSLRCEIVEIRLSGVGDADVYASDAVDAKVSGVGGIDIYGSPKRVEKSKGFLSDINIK